MKFFLLPILILFSVFYSAQDFDNRLSSIIKNFGISDKVNNVLLFTEKSSTIHLNDYDNIFVTVDISALEYINSDFKGNFEIFVSNKMIYNKTSLKNMYCYNLSLNKYLVLKINSNSINQKTIIGDQNRCDCNQLFSIKDSGRTMPQSVFHYYANGKTLNFVSIGSFDALQFLEIEFLSN